MIKLTNLSANWLFPRRCFVCERDLTRGSLCVSCRSLCHDYPCTSLRGVKNHAAVFYNEFVIKNLIVEAKYNKKIIKSHLLMKLIEETLTQSPLIREIRSFSPSVITYVPSHWFNIAVRGSHLPTLFAITLSRMIRVPMKPLLMRGQLFSRQVLKKTRSERQQSVRGLFQLTDSRRGIPRILLVDDITTTGATFDEAAKTLRKIAAEVHCVAMAKTP